MTSFRALWLLNREPGWDTPLHGPLSPLLPEALEPGLCSGAHNPVGCGVAGEGARRHWPVRQTLLTSP